MSDVKVLVVEDESIVAMDIKHRLETLGYLVPDVAASGHEAIEKIAEIGPDLVLMDIVLKGEMDGVEAARKIRDHFDIPVIYLTAYSDEKTLKRAKVTGPFGYIIKPFEDRELHSTIEIALYKHKMESKLKESEKWLSTTLESIGDAVITTNNEGKITFMNPIARQLTGWSEEEAIGKAMKDIFRIINEETGAPIKDPVTKVLQNGSITGLKDRILLITKQGAQISINDTSAPIRDDKGDINGVVLIFQDITERRKAEREKEQLLKEKARSEIFGFLVSAMPVFASNIPPQIRNNIVKSFADRFETNIKPKFKEANSNRLNVDNNQKDPEKSFSSYISWISEFLSNLGIETTITSTTNGSYLEFSNCPWIEEAKCSPMFCLICRAIIIRSFTWASIKGGVQQTSCMADGANGCTFGFNLIL